LKKIFLLIAFLIPVLLFAQELNYVHYDTKDGLAGSTVYSMCQDKDGFMWFATENGLSRFDGTHFKNFTVKEGLPDNEVLILYPDSKGRLWIGTFSKELCYYYNGSIHTKENDSLVKKLNVNADINAIAEDANHFLAFSCRYFVMVVKPDNNISRYNLCDISGGKNYDGTVFENNGRLLIHIPEAGAYYYNTKNFGWEKIASYTTYHAFVEEGNNIYNRLPLKLDSVTNKILYILVPGKVFSRTTDGNLSEYYNTTDGTWSIDTVNAKLGYHYLPGKKISKSVRDKEKNLWFCSLGSGVYKLPSQSVRTVLFSNNKEGTEKEVFSIIGYKDGIIAGGEFSKGVMVDKNFETTELDYSKQLLTTKKNPGTNRLYSMKQLSPSLAILGFDLFLVKLENDKCVFSKEYTTKSIDKIDEDYVLVGTSFYAFKMRIADLRITDTIWRERTTKVFYKNRHYYIGTLKGLYEVNEDKSNIYLGDKHPALKRRITDIKSTTDNALCIATSDNGVVIYKDGSIKKLLNESNGLSSNICKTLFVDGPNLWVGTDKGINKINTSDGKYSVTAFSVTDGLPSNVINALYVKDSIVWIGSPQGLTYFNENSMSVSSMCVLKMQGVYVSGKEIAADSSYNLSFKNNNINFQYSGISFRSGGEITYYYKLTGLDNEWKTTTANNIDYKSLPANNYELELYAVNKYAVKSATIKIKFSVTAPFWKTIWFYGLLAVLTFVLIAWLFNSRYKKTKQRLEEKNNFQKQFAILEQQALQAQMNPHFIFNCLNSIQQYILTNNKEKANEYLTGFAALIRQTLDSSNKKTVTVAEEVNYLSQYLQMEKMRFGDNFKYDIAVDELIDADYIELPALLLQPYVENSLRHGLRYKEDGKGKVDITFMLQNEKLCCSVKDNGIGREKAAAFKSSQHIEYQSKGMALTAKRIELLNKTNENKITVTIVDLKDADGNACGTEIILKIPV
jgi:ligand-binding sensor domain-containing protein/two-component sensor histidine kinase